MLPETGKCDPIKGLLSDCSDTEAARMGEIKQAEKDPPVRYAADLYKAVTSGVPSVTTSKVVTGIGP
jgi:hypothetical protein